MNPDGGVFWSLFFLSFIFIPLICLWGFVLVDLFQRHLSGWAKVAWLLAILVFPFLGALIYLLAHGQPEGASNANPGQTYL